MLLRKSGEALQDAALDFVGFDIEDMFVIGYGPYYDGVYRNLPYIAVLRRAAEGSGITS